MEKTLLYLGEDLEFIKALGTVPGRYKDAAVYVRAPEEKALLSLCLSIEPQVVYLDLDHSYLIEEISLLRSIPALKSILLIGVCKDEQMAMAAETFLIAGINLIHLQDTDADGIIDESIQLAVDGNRPPGSFARAKKLSIPLSLSFHATLSRVSSSSFTIEADFIPPSLAFKLPMAIDFPPFKMEVASHYQGGHRENFLHCLEVNYPFPSAWDSPSPDHLDPATVATWIDLKKSSFDLKKACVVIFSEKTEALIQIGQRKTEARFQFFSSVADSSGRLLLSRPQMIIYDIQLAEGADLQQLSELIAGLKDLELSPIVMVFGSPSDSKALQKIFDYEFILANPHTFTMDLYQLMEEKFLARKQSASEEFFLERLDKDRIIHLPVNVTLTSLSERDMTFLIDDEIPYFSTAKISLPFPALLTVIPAEGQLPAVRDKKHYRALIHGIEEITLAKLRKIVNQLIFVPVEALTMESVEKMLKQDYVTKEVVPWSETPSPDEGPQKHLMEEAQSMNKKQNNRRKYIGTSKL